MKISLLCSCGLLIEEDGLKIAVDLPCADVPPFAPLSAEHRDAFSRSLPPFDGLTGIVFTHRHPDHYDRHLLRAFHEQHPEVPIFVPGMQTPDSVTLDWGAQIELRRVAHVPVAGYPPISQFAYLIRLHGRLVYVTGDAEADEAPHLAFLNDQIPDAAFYNGQFLNHPATRLLLTQHAAKSFIYHIPPDTEDVSGMRRKCDHAMQRYAQELPNVTLLETYPTVIEL